MIKAKFCDREFQDLKFVNCPIIEIYKRKLVVSG